MDWYKNVQVTTLQKGWWQKYIMLSLIYDGSIQNGAYMH
jgi:hypothetical protein